MTLSRKASIQPYSPEKGPSQKERTPPNHHSFFRGKLAVEIFGGVFFSIKICLSNSRPQNKAQALPEYYNAIKALDSLDKKDIQEAFGDQKPKWLSKLIVSSLCCQAFKKNQQI